MDEAFSCQIALRKLEHGAGTLILFFGTNGVDLELEALQILVPLPMLLHECIGSAGTCCARGENQNVALGFTLFRCPSFIKGLDHEYIVNGNRPGILC